MEKHEMFEVRGKMFWVDFDEAERRATISAPNPSEFDPQPVSPPFYASSFDNARKEALTMAERFMAGRLAW